MSNEQQVTNVGRICDFGQVRQLGYLVENVEQSVAAWMKHLGVGPWTVIKNVPLQCIYRGEKTQPVIDLALGYRGDVQIELIQQTNDAPSPYLKYFQEKRFALHHTAYLSEDIDGTVSHAEINGHEIICDIHMPDGGRYVYTQIPEMGEEVFIEFLAATDSMKKMFSDGIAAAASWNGEEQVTVVDYTQFA